MRRALPWLVIASLTALGGCDGGGGSMDAGTDSGPSDAGTDAPYVPPNTGPPDPVSFGAVGSSSAASGEGSFRFGVATAATQIEDMNPHTDWHAWTSPESEGGLGNGTFVGDAVRGYSLAVEDVALLEQLNVDSYRFSMEWARIEPMRDTRDMEGVAHYRTLLEALDAAGIQPNVTVHHFSNPVWIEDPRIDPDMCTDSESQLCGWAVEASVPLIVEEIREHACFLGTTYGDLVDDWGTINEPVNYMFAGWGSAQFPPGRAYVFGAFDRFLRVVRAFISAHSAIYDALKECDTVDADGDGVAASVGLPLSVANWVPSRGGRPSANPEDVAAAERMTYVYHYLFVDSVMNGTFDPGLDGTAEELHPEWLWTPEGGGEARPSIDWLGLQYYFRAGVTARPALLPVLNVTPCFGPLNSGACLAPAHETFWVPDMGYEFWPAGFLDVMRAVAGRYPELPLMVTEAGIATHVGERRAENVVRVLEQVAVARAEGIDLRGYYHWSLMDNFEWAEGYEPLFGLFTVDRESAGYTRTPTLGATVYGAIAGSRMLTMEQRVTYGGLGPMTPEPTTPEM